MNAEDLRFHALNMAHEFSLETKAKDETSDVLARAKAYHEFLAGEGQWAPADKPTLAVQFVEPGAVIPLTR